MDKPNGNASKWNIIIMLKWYNILAEFDNIIYNTPDASVFKNVSVKAKLA